MRLKRKLQPAMVYIMNYGGIGTPSWSYLQTIRDGYEEAGFDIDILDQAVESCAMVAQLMRGEVDGGDPSAPWRVAGPPL